MADFSKEELTAAAKALASSIRKIEKVRETLLKKSPPPASQLTLAKRNLHAFKVSMALIERELERLS